MSAHTPLDHLLGHLRDWWQGRNSLVGLDAAEVDHIARDLGISSDDLRDLAARGPDAADLLLERMAALGLTRADLDAAATGLMQDLQKTCAHCRDKGQCEKELVYRPQQHGWQRYCPNASTLEAIARAKRNLDA